LKNEQSTLLMVTTRTDTAHGPTYSMTRTIGASTWQKRLICRCTVRICTVDWLKVLVQLLC